MTAFGRAGTNHKTDQKNLATCAQFRLFRHLLSSPMYTREEQMRANMLETAMLAIAVHTHKGKVVGERNTELLTAERRGNHPIGADAGNNTSLLGDTRKTTRLTNATLPNRDLFVHNRMPPSVPEDRRIRKSPRPVIKSSTPAPKSHTPGRGIEKSTQPKPSKTSAERARRKTGEGPIKGPPHGKSERKNCAP
ncbi:hypothetical protein BO85DRAFT_441840 [Aspergillus piperis CBS 112811]|uniref:Uncharacterized protein n=1 Tax=Aspergillus piperis CBS 112811 TaxID=1448313 RepID=A0A8G1QWJ8_9EURO|nr:hypothetical protein BO85DRAFT_441840 [Aspergillus piperis CBS 112811]RAH53909.1 hypothetical protein BO85DRAFT_441840 [Aspergillus piperis CBS 112811]